MDRHEELIWSDAVAQPLRNRVMKIFERRELCVSMGRRFVSRSPPIDVGVPEVKPTAVIDRTQVAHPHHFSVKNGAILSEVHSIYCTASYASIADPALLPS